MIQLTPHMKIWVAKEPIDFRCGIDGTSAACRRVIEQDPMSGALFIFRNRIGNMIRVLGYDGQGFWLATKRLSKGKFRHWGGFPQDAASVTVDPHQLHLLLVGADWTQARPVEYWRKIA
jgi:transposase